MTVAAPFPASVSTFKSEHGFSITVARLRGLLADKGMTDVTVLVGGIIAGFVLLVGSVATLIPATRAARVNPVTALRSE